MTYLYHSLFWNHFCKIYISKCKDDHKLNSDFECGTCKERFHKKRVLNSHIFREHGGVNLWCKICNKTFKTTQEYERHVYSVHVTTRNFKCEICEKTFKSKFHLKEHITRVHKNKTALKKKYKCDKCSSEFRVPYDLKRHIMSVHEFLRFNCEICNISFSAVESLNKHKKRLHSTSNLILKYPKIEKWKIFIWICYMSGCYELNKL